jgi:hypothetical protein
MIRAQGVIVEWSRERGFGKVECEGIGTLVFDGSNVAEEDLHVGEQVVVDVVEFRGRKRATSVQRDVRWRKRT